MTAKYGYTAALVAIAMAVVPLSAGSAKANIIFGNVNPSPGCGPASGPGHVCGITETFTSGTDTIIANGFSGAPAPGTGNLNLTLKGGPAAPAPLLPSNILAESGLGTDLNAGRHALISTARLLAPLRSRQPAVPAPSSPTQSSARCKPVRRSTFLSNSPPVARSLSLAERSGPHVRGRDSRWDRWRIHTSGMPLPARPALG